MKNERLELKKPITISENLNYKATDHLFRNKDEYARAKYDITTHYIQKEAQAGMKLINIGCGSGEYNHIATAMGLEVLACEPDPYAFQMSIKNQPKLGCKIQNCGIFELVGKTEPADFLIMHDVLEHIQDEELTINAITSLVKKNGTIIISVPALSWLYGYHDQQLGHFRRYSKGTLLPLFREKFQIEKSRYFGMTFIPVALWFSRIKKKPYLTPHSTSQTIRRLLRIICQFESVVPLPIGTSILFKARKI